MNPNCPIPNNINPLSPTGFRLSIQKLPDVSFFAQEVTLPDLSLPNIEMKTPLSAVSIPGELLEYGDFTINFLVDEEMKNYTAIYNWMIGLGFPEDHNQYGNFTKAQSEASNYNVRNGATNYSDGVLEILGSNNVGVKSITFVDLNPVSLSSLTFKSDETDINYLTGTVTFRYTLFKL